MRLLLDEVLDIKFRHHLSPRFRVETAEYRGWKGLENGDLLRTAEADFDVLVTRDRHISDEQNLSRFDIAIAVLRPREQGLEYLIELVPELENKLTDLDSGEVVEIQPPQPRTCVGREQVCSQRF